MQDLFSKLSNIKITITKVVKPGNLHTLLRSRWYRSLCSHFKCVIFTVCVENYLMKRIFVTKKVESRTSWRKTNKEETHDFCSSAKYRFYAGIKDNKMD